MSDDKGVSGQPYRVMLVDDSKVMRSYLGRLLEKNQTTQLVAEAENGVVALARAQAARPEVILLDVEMPVMDGITALPQLLRLCPDAGVIMVSTLTKVNAEISIKAMSMGAWDYIEKPSAEGKNGVFEERLMSKIRALVESHRRKLVPQARHIGSVPEKTLLQPIPEAMTAKLSSSAAPMQPVVHAKPGVLAVGSSTGGPQALADFFRGLGNRLSDMPVFITQHMPPKFTTFLAERLSQVGGIRCFEPTDGHPVMPGEVYLAPGDFHMVVQKERQGVVIRLNQAPAENFCRPSVEPMLRSLVQVYGEHILMVMLTGMGRDGCEGAKQLVAAGGRLLAQDEATSVVWGMPGAVAQAGICEAVLPLNELAPRVIQICKGEE